MVFVSGWCFITFRVLDVADLTVEGNVSNGAAISAILITKWYEPNPIYFDCRHWWYGRRCCNRLDSYKLKIPALLAGIFNNDCFILH